jgi:hypothetical protein
MFRRFDPVSGLVLEETAPGVADNNSLFFFMSTGHAVMNEFSKARAAVMGLFSLGISALDSQPLQQTTYGDFTLEAGDWVLERVTTASDTIVQHNMFTNKNLVKKRLYGFTIAPDEVVYVGNAVFQISLIRPVVGNKIYYKASNNWKTYMDYDADDMRRKFGADSGYAAIEERKFIRL